MTLVSPELGQRFEELRQRFASSNRTEDTATNRSEVKLVKNQNSEAKVRGFTLIQDEPESVGGTGKGPTPLDFFAASIGFCENVTFTRHATLSGVEFESLETSVRGHRDRKGQYEIDGAHSSFIDMTVETGVTTKASVERVAQVARLAHRTCPMHATIVEASPVTDELFVNGREVPP